MRALMKKYFARWLDRRIPRQREMTLNQRRIFIFPTLQGFYFLIVLLLLLLAAINYQNNLIYVLVFFLASLFNTAIVFTYLNISGLHLSAGRTSPVYAGDFAEFELHIKSDGTRQHLRIELGFADAPKQMVDLAEEQTQSVSLLCKSHARGRFRPGRLLLESHYPLGLMRCWSWIDLDFSTLAYPKPVPLNPLPVAQLAGDEGLEKPQLGVEDFFGFRSYQAGDSLRHVDWRSMARGLPLQSKVYSAKEQQQSYVDWDSLPGIGVELRLSQLCDWALQLEQNNIAWGLRMPGVDIAPNSGDKHRHQAFSHLALWGIDSGKEEGDKHA